MTDTKQTDQLNDELMDLEFEMLDKISTLIESKWNAPVIQQELENLAKERGRLHSELAKTGYYDSESKEKS